MKIGIITTHRALNSGAVLQAYASQTFLSQLGHEVEFIDYKEPWRKPLRRYISKNPILVWYSLIDSYYRHKYLKEAMFNKVLHIGKKRYSTLFELQNEPPIYDLYMVGSDQVWNVGSSKKINRAHYLDFGLKSVKRISYAASLGQGNVPDYMLEEMKELLMKFDHISVRESSGVKLIQSIVGNHKKVFHTFDPTLLLEADDYSSIMEEIPQEGPYITCYSLAIYEDEQKKAMSYIQKKLNLPIKNLRNPDTCRRLKNVSNIIVTPYQWLAYVKNSNFVICTSFHAVVFSLIFHRPFIVLSPFVNKRIMSLLKLVNLKERFIENYEKNNIDAILSNQIDWELVDKKIRDNRQSSIDYLLNAITN